MYFNCHYLLFSNENITWVRIDFLIEKKCHKKANFISILLSTHVYICILNIYYGNSPRAFKIIFVKKFHHNAGRQKTKKLSKHSP